MAGDFSDDFSDDFDIGTTTVDGEVDDVTGQAIIDQLTTLINLVKAKTDKLQFTTTYNEVIAAPSYHGSVTTPDTATDDALTTLQTATTAIKAKTDNLPSDPADASVIAGAFTTVNTTLGTLATSSALSTLQTSANAINAKTTNLPASPAAVGSAMTVSDKTGFKLASDGLDGISVESGINVRQATSVILAAAGGAVSGAGTGTVVLKAGGNTITRVTAQTDNSGNRTSVTFSLPT